MTCAGGKYDDTFIPSRRKLNLEGGIEVFTENLQQQRTNQDKQSEILEAEKKKIEIMTEKEQYLLQVAKSEAAKCKALAEIEINKQKQLAAIEIEAKRRQLEQLAELELQAKRRELNL